MQFIVSFWSSAPPPFFTYQSYLPFPTQLLALLSSLCLPIPLLLLLPLFAASILDLIKPSLFSILIKPTLFQHHCHHCYRPWLVYQDYSSIPFKSIFQVFLSNIFCLVFPPNKVLPSDMSGKTLPDKPQTEGHTQEGRGVARLSSYTHTPWHLSTCVCGLPGLDRTTSLCSNLQP